ncbi:hypothetical protein LP7551_04175 [Roseibium album]|nr:hypothetical protein LP7551_04175 [Roseibium album]
MFETIRLTWYCQGSDLNLEDEDTQLFWAKGVLSATIEFSIIPHHPPPNQIEWDSGSGFKASTSLPAESSS